MEREQELNYLDLMKQTILTKATEEVIPNESYNERVVRVSNEMRARYRRLRKRNIRKECKEKENVVAPNFFSVINLMGQLNDMFCEINNRDDLMLHSYNEGVWVLHDSRNSGDYVVDLNIKEMYNL